MCVYVTYISRSFILSVIDNLLHEQLYAQGIYYMFVSTFLINTCMQALLLYIGTMMIKEGTLSPEILLAFMLYQSQLQVREI